jgi:hypothetical protein
MAKYESENLTWLSLLQGVEVSIRGDKYLKEVGVRKI